MSDNKPIDDLKINPIDYFNENHIQYVFNLMTSKPLGHITGIDSFSFTKTRKLKKKPMIKIQDNHFIAIHENDLGLEIGEVYTPFRMLVEFHYKGKWRQAIEHIVIDIMHKEVEYIRVGTRYFKKIIKIDHNGLERMNLKAWDRATIIDDYGKPYLDKIPAYEDFVIHPDNKIHKYVIGGCYNLYAPFEHIPLEKGTKKDFPWIDTLINHIFGEQYELGIRYLKALYDLPKHSLPILVLTSEERSTGKTTFLNFIEILFGRNTCSITPQDIGGTFNGIYAESNIIMIEESKFDSIQAIEKLKNIATAKVITVNNKYALHYTTPFYGKIIITSNDENKFSRVDDQEIRYWVRKVPTLEGKANHGIMKDLKNEIPAFLAYLNSLPDIDVTKSRMIFTPEEIKTEALTKVKRESRSELHKEIEMMLDDHSTQNTNIEEFYFVPLDIKNKWFKNQNNFTGSYIKKVLENEMHLPRCEKEKMWYIPLENGTISKQKQGRNPFVFKNPYYDTDIRPEQTFSVSKTEEEAFAPRKKRPAKKIRTDKS